MLLQITIHKRAKQTCEFLFRILDLLSDDYVYPNQNKNNSTYDQILRLLNQCNDYQLQVILATTTALLDSNPFIANVDTTNDTK